MTAYERLMAEALPTGTFGDAPRTPAPARRPVPEGAGAYTVPNPVTPEQAAANLRVLEAALDGWAYDEPARDAERRHLRAVPDQAAA